MNYGAPPKKEIVTPSQNFANINITLFGSGIMADFFKLG
jgi:hypothetical protein